MINLILQKNKERFLYLGIELMQKSLEKFLEKKIEMTSIFLIDIMYQIARGMCYLHDMHIAH